MLLAEAEAAGLHLWREGARVRWRGDPPPGLIERLRARKAEVAEVLDGERCRRCGERLAWPGPVGVIYADGTAEHHGCRLRAAAERALLAPDALADEAEVMLRGEALP
jgi:hypothetical protein